MRSPLFRGIELTLWVVVAALFLWRVAPQARAALGWGSSGSAAPAVTLDMLDGGTGRLADLKGRVVLVNFWATWCPPCREEMPSLTRLAQSFDPQTFEVVTVSVDEGWEPIDKFLSSQKTPFRVALDEGAKISRTYGTTKFPESYLLDRDGKVRLKFVGPRNWMDPNVATLLEQYGARRKG